MLGVAGPGVRAWPISSPTLAGAPAAEINTASTPPRRSVRADARNSAADACRLFSATLHGVPHAGTASRDRGRAVRCRAAVPPWSHAARRPCHGASWARLAHRNIRTVRTTHHLHQLSPEKILTTFLSVTTFPRLSRESRHVPGSRHADDQLCGVIRARKGDSHHPNHTVLARRLQDYLHWRKANARHPDVLAAQRRERARIRSQRQQRWGMAPGQGRIGP